MGNIEVWLVGPDGTGEDAQRARELVEAALKPGSRLYIDHGPDRLLAAAQVYATLSTRTA